MKVITYVTLSNAKNSHTVEMDIISQNSFACKFSKPISFNVGFPVLSGKLSITSKKPGLN